MNVQSRLNQGNEEDRSANAGRINIIIMITIIINIIIIIVIIIIIIIVIMFVPDDPYFRIVYFLG